jgi:hypothetical protein
MMLASSIVFGALATAAGLLAPSQMQLIVPVASSASVGEVAFPIGHWLAAAIWIAVVLSAERGDRRHVLLQCIAIAFALHFLILLALFVPRLRDEAAFSARVYLLYAQWFCVIALAAATAWAWRWLQRMRSAPVRPALESAVLFGWAALAVSLARYHVVLAAIGLVAGVVAAFAYERGQQRGFLASFRDGARADIAIMTVLFGVAVALRLIYVGRIMSDANYLDAGADGRIYDELAWSIASGNGVPASFSDRYPLLLLGNVWLSAAVYAIAGRSYFTLTAIQSILGALACVLVYDTARRVFDRPTAIVAGAFAAVSFPLVFAAATVGHQAWDVFFTALTVWLLVRLIATGGTAWQWMVAGAVVGLSFTIRETNIFFAALLVPWIVWFHPHGRRAAVRPLAAFVAGGALMVLPFIAPKVWSPEVRAGMRGHFDRMYRGEGGSRPTSRTELAGPLTDPSAALSQLQSDPGRVVKTLAAEYADNFAAQFLTQPYGGFDVVFLRKGSDYYYGMWFYAYALTIAGTLLVVRRLPAGSLPAAASALILGLLVARTVPHLMLASDYRHRAPLEPFLILLAAIGAVAVAREAMATAASTSTSGFTGSDWRVSQSSGT